MGIARPIECKTVADQPFPEVGSPDKTCRDRTPILVRGNRGATHRTSGDETIEFVGRLGAAAIQIAVGTPAQLIAFRRVDTPKPDPGSMYVQRITIDDTGLSDNICSGGRPGQGRNVSTRVLRLLTIIGFQRSAQIARIKLRSIFELLRKAQRYFILISSRLSVKTIARERLPGARGQKQQAERADKKRGSRFDCQALIRLSSTRLRRTIRREVSSAMVLDCASWLSVRDTVSIVKPR